MTSEMLLARFNSAMKNKPCGCPWGWVKGQYTKVGLCGGCVAIAEYELFLSKQGN